jgi:enoyl-CoA hydratase
MINAAVEDGIAFVSMVHGKANALDTEFCEAMAALFKALRTSDAKAVVLSAPGNIFSAGVDLKRVSAGGADYVREFLPSLHKMYDAVFFHPKPVIAAINGHAIAGGAVLAACADRRIMAAPGGRIGITELLVGVPLPALAFEIVRFAVPERNLPEFALTGATFDTDAALARGWVDEVVEPEALLARARAAAAFYVGLAPRAFAQTKMQLRLPVSERYALNGEATDKAVTDIWTAPETLAYVKAYVEKTLGKQAAR